MCKNRKRSNPDSSGPVNTDSPDTEIAQSLLDTVFAEGFLEEHDVKDKPLYYTVFENEFGTEITNADFKEIVALEGARHIKHKLDTSEKVVGVIALHSNSVDVSPRISPNCSDDELYIDAIKNNGHYIFVCIISDGKKHQYFLGDSAGKRNHFTKNPVVGDLIQYFESKDLSEPVSLDSMTQVYSFNEDSHIYKGWLLSLFGSSRKNRPNNIEHSTGKNYALYALTAFCTYAAYSYYLKASSENLLTHSVPIS